MSRHRRARPGDPEFKAQRHDKPGGRNKPVHDGTEECFHTAEIRFAIAIYGPAESTLASSAHALA
jgi:hypothetical protein